MLARFKALCRPRQPERQRLNARRWSSLDPALRTPQQALGRSYVACGATHGVMERCDFGCTSCYLTELANTTPALPFEAVAQQLDEMRAALGPAGKAQITAGEVTLLPVAELGRIVQYAREIGLDPMVMTHGQHFEQQPDYLPTLVQHYGLEKIAIHIDSTQRGRKGAVRGAGERALDHVRDRFADLVRGVRNKTGRKLHVAHTITVTAETLDDIPDTMRWMLDNVDAFRMISFQPTAEVGRTRDRRMQDVGLDDVWGRICDGVGQKLNRDAMQFGHRECNITCPLALVSFRGRHEVIECVREGNRWDLRVMRKILEQFGGYSVVGARRFESTLRMLGLLLRAPLFMAELVAYGAYRVWGIRAWILQALSSGFRPGGLRVRPLAVIVHKFMSEDGLDTPLGRERLAACAFQLPVNGNMVPMCEMNGTDLRRRLNESLRVKGRMDPCDSP